MLIFIQLEKTALAKLINNALTFGLNSMRHQPHKKIAKLAYRWFLIRISACCVCHCISCSSTWPCIFIVWRASHAVLFALFLSAHWSLVVGTMSRMNKIHCTYGKTIHSFAYDSPLTHRHTPSRVYASQSNKRLIHFYQRCLRYGVCIAWVWHTSLPLELKPFEPVLARWSMSELQSIFLCVVIIPPAKRYRFIYLFPSEVRAKRCFQWKRGCYFQLLCAQSLRHDKQNKI